MTPEYAKLDLNITASAVPFQLCSPSQTLYLSLQGVLGQLTQDV